MLASFSPLKNKNSAPELSPNGAPKLPEAVRDKLELLGINGNALLEVQSDLGADGRWGERFLVATKERVVVLSRQNADGNSAQKPDANADVSVDFDAPLSEILATESKNLVGAASLEARLKSNGHAPNTDNQKPTTEHVVELLRSSGARSKELAAAARQLQHLREQGSLAPEIAQDEKWQRRLCPSCGRALPPDSDICPFCVNKWQALRRLFGYLGPYKWVAVANGFLSVAGILLSFVPILLVQPLVDRVFHVSKKSAGALLSDAAAQHLLLMLVGGIVGSSLLGAVVNMVRGRSVAFLGARIIHDIRAQLYEQLQRLSLSYYDKREVGAVMSRVQNDTQMLQNFLLDAAENIILSSLTIAGVVIVMLSKSWVLALAVLAPVPVVVLLTNRYWRGLMKLWRRVWHQNSVLGARLADSLGGVRVVRAFAQEDKEVGRFTQKSSELSDATMRVEQKAALFYPIMGFVMGLGLPITWLVGGREVLNATLTFGELTVFIFFLNKLYEPVQVLTRLVNFLTRAMTAAERVFEILDTTPEIRENSDAVPMPRVVGKVEFRDATFGYDKHRPVLHGINLEVEAGEMIGLVGHSGAGKSTLINLLMRFYDVDEGAILIDGVDIRKIRRDDVRHQIGVVLQEPYLFHGTVAENIAYGKEGAAPAEIMAAAKAAFAHDFIVSFPDGYDTVVGERGTRLSGGERQRISIARAILHDPRILILDEATASVDTQTESQIQQALRNLTQGRTTFAIAHRLSTLRNANRLIVLESGKIAEMGTHDELLANRGTFYKLVHAQQAMNEINAIGG